MNERPSWLRLTALGGMTLLFLFAGGLLGIAAFFAGKGDVPNELKLVALIAAGTAVLVVSLAGLASLLIVLGYGDQQEALGMPSGSVRAFMAIMLIALFATLVVWLFGQIDDKDEQTRFAFQVLTTLSTLVVAVAAFYFGTRSVRTAAEAVRGVPGPVIDDLQPSEYSLDASTADPVRFVARGSGLGDPSSVVFSHADPQKELLTATVESSSGVNVRFRVPKTQFRRPEG